MLRLRARLGDQPCNQLLWIRADGAGHQNELDDIEAPFAAFVFGDEGLRFFEPAGDFGLSQSDAPPLTQENSLKEYLSPAVNRFSHALSADGGKRLVRSC